MTAALLIALAAAAAPAVDDHRAAEQAEHDGDPAAAEALYRHILAEQPGTPIARTAAARLDWLQARNVDGYRPLTALMKMRLTVEKGVNRAQLEAFDAQVGSFPPGLVRHEARALVAETAAHDLHDYPFAERLFHTWLEESDLTAADREAATVGLARVVAEQGHFHAAVGILSAAGLSGRPIYYELKALAARQVGEPLSIALLAIFGVLAVLILARRLSLQVLREALRPGNILLAAYVVVTPAIIAVRYDSALAYTFQRLGLSLAAVLGVGFVVGAALGSRPSPRLLRVGAAVSVALACASVGFLVISQSEMLAGLFRWRGL